MNISKQLLIAILSMSLIIGGYFFYKSENYSNLKYEYFEKDSMIKRIEPIQKLYLLKKYEEAMVEARMQLNHAESEYEKKIIQILLYLSNNKRIETMLKEDSEKTIRLANNFPEQFVKNSIELTNIMESNYFKYVDQDYLNQLKNLSSDFDTSKFTVFKGKKLNYIPYLTNLQSMNFAIHEYLNRLILSDMNHQYLSEVNNVHKIYLYDQGYSKKYPKNIWYSELIYGTIISEITKPSMENFTKTNLEQKIEFAKSQLQLSIKILVLKKSNNEIIQEEREFQELLEKIQKVMSEMVHLHLLFSKDVAEIKEKEIKYNLNRESLKNIYNKYPGLIESFEKNNINGNDSFNMFVNSTTLVMFLQKELDTIIKIEDVNLMNTEIHNLNVKLKVFLEG